MNPIDALATSIGRGLVAGAAGTAVAPPVVFWAKEEIAIDALHHLVCAAATGLAYRLIERRRG